MRHVKDALSGFLHSTLLPPVVRFSVGMTRVMRVAFTLRHFCGSLAGYREAAAEPILHPAVSPRLDPRDSGWQVERNGVYRNRTQLQMRRSGENSLMRHVEGRRVGIPPLNLAPCGRSVSGRNDNGLCASRLPFGIFAGVLLATARLQRSRSLEKST
jgi:hypothetical protein